MTTIRGGAAVPPRLLVTDEVIGLRPLSVQDTAAQMAGEDEELVGTVGIQSGMPYLRDGQVNITYGIYPASRGRGLATRSVLLAMRLAASRAPVQEFVIRVDPDNEASAGVARHAGFAYLRHTDDSEGILDWYVLLVPSDDP